MNLYELTEQQAELVCQMYLHVDEDGVIADDFCDMLDGAQMAIEQKLVAIQCIRIRAQAEEEMYKREIERLQRKSKASARLDKRLKEYIESFMARTEQKAVAAGTFKFRLQKNAPKLVIDGKIPEDYIEFLLIEKPNDEAIKDALKRGEVLDFAHLEQSETLRVA